MNNEIEQRSESAANPDNDLSNVSAMMAALEHTQNGRPVFPCRPDKRPYTTSGFKDATTTPGTIIAWWTQWPDALIGMPTGQPSGIDVLDIDVKNGHDGEATLRGFEEKHGAIPETTEVRTQSGGRHLWFKHTNGLGNSAGKLGDGLDVRADGGYVILPGAGNYEFTKENEIPDPPAWFVAAAEAKPTEKPMERPSGTDGALQAGTRNQGLASQAGKMRRSGMSPAAIEAALSVINDERCKPPLSEREVRNIAQSVGRYEPESDPEPETVQIPSWAELAIDPLEACNASLTPTCIVDQYLYADVAQLVAPGGTGKTTLLLWEAAHIVLGRKLWGLDVHNPGKVLIITAEDERERLVARLARIVEAMALMPADAAKVYSSIGIYDVAGSGVKLTRFKDGNIELTSLADDIIAAMKNDPPVLVVFDPLVSFGASEQAVNDNEQNLIMASRRIVKGLGCCVRLVHHTGKQNAREATLDQYTGRGGSALADGSRMTTVMQAWSLGGKQELPADMELRSEDSVTILNRAKLSYAPPNRSIWFIRRRGFEFMQFEQHPQDSEQRTERLGKRVLATLRRQILSGILKSKTELEDSMPKALGITRIEYRNLIQSLLDNGKLVLKDLPQHLRHGKKKEFYCPADIAKEELKVVPLKEESEAE